MKIIFLLLFTFSTYSINAQITFVQVHNMFNKTEEVIKSEMSKYSDYKYKGKNNKANGYLICYRNMTDFPVQTHANFTFNEDKTCYRIDLVYGIAALVDLTLGMDENLKKFKEGHYSDGKFNYEILLSDIFDKNGYNEYFTVIISIKK